MEKNKPNFRLEKALAEEGEPSILNESSIKSKTREFPDPTFSGKTCTCNTICRCDDKCNHCYCVNDCKCERHSTCSCDNHEYPSCGCDYFCSMTA